MRAVCAPPFGTVALPDSTAGDTVAYASYGREDAPAVFVLGGISAHRFVNGNSEGVGGWWPGVVGPGASLDPDRYRVISLDWLGGAGESTGSVTEGLGLPVVTTQDQAHAVVRVLDHLEIEQLHGFVGASYGGMVGLALGALYPERIRRLLVLCAAHRPHPMAVALRVLQRRIIELSSGSGRELEGLALARELAMTTYRTPEEFEQRFASSPNWDDGSPRFAVEDYLEYQGERFAQRFDARAFRILTQSLDIHRVEPEDVLVPTTVMSVDSDTLVPPWLVAELARRLPASGRAVRITSSFGHDAFLKEHQAVSRLILNVLETEDHSG
jgi:homoserine O-acetyltransferase